LSEDLQQALFAIRDGILVKLRPTLASDVHEDPEHEVIERHAWLVEAPPHSPRERAHVPRGGLVEPVPCQGRFAGAPDGGHD
jgi:hypothetical protein